MAAAASRSSKTECDLFVSEVGVLSKRYAGRSEILRPSDGAAAEKKSSNSVRVGGDAIFCLSTPTDVLH